MLSDSIVRKLYGEKSQYKAQVVADFVRTCKLPSLVLTDVGRAAYYYKCYSNVATNKTNAAVNVDANNSSADNRQLPLISSPYFLYLWLCMREPKPVNVNMKGYYLFSNADVKVEQLSYRYFTQIYVDAVSYNDKLNVHYSCFFSTTMHHRYPISLKSLMDKLYVATTSEYIVVCEGGLLMIKKMPQLMEDPEQVADNIRYERESLVASLGSSYIVSTHAKTTLESTNNQEHSRHTTLLSILTDSLGKSQENVANHCFSFPSREFNYNQVCSWAITHNIKHFTNVAQRSVVFEDYISNSRCEVVNRTLDSNKCYDNGDYEVYRLKGDIVLEIIVSSRQSREQLEQQILKMYHELDHTISEHYPDPMDLGSVDIETLRATNSIAFDSMYCRKAPPRVQPIVIRLEQVQTELDKGKMIFVYEGRYYTTKDRHLSGGADYIGIVNKFGDYDPNRPYNPIIRTYKKNHLHSKTFKEFKAYLLRLSVDPNWGYISRDDLLLPKQMEKLYKVKIHNPSPDIAVIHTKKTTVSNIGKVSTGEVPDYIKTMLGTSNVKRIINKKRGTGLLNACGVDSADFLEYMLAANYAKDLMPLTREDIVANISANNVDHRLYGKHLEDCYGWSIIVFSMEGVVPYRYSKLSKDVYKLLFMSADGTYDVIAALMEETQEDKLAKIRDTINSSVTVCECVETVTEGRDVDYTLVMLKLVSHVSAACNSIGLRVVYELIAEDKCKDIVEQVYESCLYYESIVSNTAAEFIESLVTVRKSSAVLINNYNLLRHVVKDMIRVDDNNTVVIASPVDMSSYNLWNISLEDCLYFSPYCYKLSKRHEVQCRAIL